MQKIYRPNSANCTGILGIDDMVNDGTHKIPDTFTMAVSETLFDTAQNNNASLDNNSQINSSGYGGQTPVHKFKFTPVEQNITQIDLKWIGDIYRGTAKFVSGHGAAIAVWNETNQVLEEIDYYDNSDPTFGYVRHEFNLSISANINDYIRDGAVYFCVYTYYFGAGFQQAYTEYAEAVVTYTAGGANAAAILL